MEWNRGPLGEHAGHPLRDARVTVKEVDVSVLLTAEARAFDAILLDVDNGPEGLTLEGNDWLYSRAGLKASYEALRPKGVLAVWSAGSDRAFSKRLRKAGFEVDEVWVPGAPGEGGPPPHLDGTQARVIAYPERKRAAPITRDGPQASIGFNHHLERYDVLRRGAFLSLNHVELHLRSLGEGLEALRLNRGVVDETVFAAVLRRDEPKALLVVKPLY